MLKIFDTLRPGLAIAAVVVAVSTLLAGCPSTPVKEQGPVGVEDRTGGQIKPPTTTTTPKPNVVDAAPVVPAQVGPGTALGDSDRSLKDPNSILSKRLIFFDFDSNLVKEEFRPLVAAHAKYVAQNGKAKMVVQGHTDERGSREYNLALGQRRADAVKQMMSVLGTEGSRIETVSFGEEKPRVQGTTEDAFSQNRRAEIVYQGE
jgi:peptidoglycan-associated lipoprotein